jgi:transcriptional regulator with XRE-family HTH domain
LGQDAFANEIGLSQSGLSLVETGKTSISTEHIDRLMKAFDTPEHRPRFSEFLSGLEQERAEGQAALSAPLGCHLTLTVWAWDGEFDLGREPSPDRAVGLVTIRTTAKRVIALEMASEAEAWSKGEILVFEECSSDAVCDNDVCLVQVSSKDEWPNTTIIGMAHVSRSARGQTLQFEPLSPAGPIFEATEGIAVYLHVVFRGRYVK